ncbi:DUF3261 domain-containing protein [Sneathiella sp.]|uniref:DUF3261 domain-containing protein n=1 Tax=Sneathiella sp. TaxID=1964365 RepID=UPI003564B563
MCVRGIFLICFLALAGCASNVPGKTEFAPWKLPDNHPREVVQILNGHYGEQDFSLQIRLSLTGERLKLAGVDALGRHAFDILWDTAGVRAGKADWVSDKLNAVDILKVIIATYWPADDPMQAQVADRAANLEITYQTTRENAWNETVVIKDPKTDYEMTIISYELTE